MKARLLFGVAGLLLVLYLLPPAHEAVPIVRYHLAMDTLIKIDLFVDEEDADRLFQVATAEIDRIDSIMSHYSASSEVTHLNDRAADEAVRVSVDLGRVLKRSLFFAGRSAGAFDITVGALTGLWDIPAARSVPRAASVDSALALVGFGHLGFADGEVRFAVDGLRLDLGAIAKGYAVDQAVDVLKRAGVGAGLIEAGGDLRYWGRKPDGRAWRFGIHHPREKHFIAVEDIGLEALATSGDYERFFEVEGKRYHHILDPRTGTPAAGCVSATAWARSAMDADALATIAFVLGPEAGLKLVESMPNTEILLFFEKEGRLHHVASAALRSQLKIAESRSDQEISGRAQTQ